MPVRAQTHTHRHTPAGGSTMQPCYIHLQQSQCSGQLSRELPHLKKPRTVAGQTTPAAAIKENIRHLFSQTYFHCFHENTQLSYVLLGNKENTRSKLCVMAAALVLASVCRVNVNLVQLPTVQSHHFISFAKLKLMKCGRTWGKGSCLLLFTVSVHILESVKVT